jgi:hypothetical protein
VPGLMGAGNSTILVDARTNSLLVRYVPTRRA